MKLLLSDIAKAVGGELIGTDLAIGSVGIDTRTLKAGDLYVGIKGQNFDGNEYVGKAIEAGAAAAILHRGFSADMPHILVEDTRIALGQLASAWRDRVSAKIVGITGSNGKTTVKEMTATILAEDGKTLYTQGNLNNDYGVPLTLFRLDESHDYGVIEMGANHQGEIAYVNKIAKPDVVILNNAGSAHIEGFGGLDGVAKGKGEIIETLKPEGIAVLNKDDNYFQYWSRIAGGRQVKTFGLHPDADVRAEGIKSEVVSNAFSTQFELIASGKRIQIGLKLAGQHNVRNALAAASAAQSLGLGLEQVKSGLESLKPVKGRLQPLVGRLGNIIIDDTYNANSTSLAAGVDVLLNCPGKHWVVLGAFGELGQDSLRIHEEIGELMRSKGVVRLLAIGPDAKNTVKAFGKGATFFDSHENLIERLAAELTGDEAILIKGSRVQQMEKVAAALVENYRT